MSSDGDKKEIGDDVEIVLDIKNDGKIVFMKTKEGLVVVQAFSTPGEEKFGVKVGDAIIAVNGYCVSTLTFQQIHDSVHKVCFILLFYIFPHTYASFSQCKLGLVALRFRDPRTSKKKKIKFGTNLPDPKEVKRKLEEAKRKKEEEDLRNRSDASKVRIKK